MAEKLQIKLLSNSGELINVINCFPNRITVLRALAHGELEPYIQALSGLASSQRFSITVGKNTYDASNYTLIGFAENLKNETKTVKEYIDSQDVSFEAISSSLKTYGLEEILNQTLEKCSSDEIRRLQIVVAAYKENSLLILNNPFEAISSKWKERFADLITRHTRNNNVITLVTSLSYRPQSWIGNDLINRVQVGANTQRTIGFSSEASQANVLVDEVRKMMKAEEQQKKAALLKEATKKEVVEESAISSKVVEKKKKRARRPDANPRIRSEKISRALDIIEKRRFPALAIAGVTVLALCTLAFWLLDDGKTTQIDEKIKMAAVKKDRPIKKNPQINQPKEIKIDKKVEIKPNKVVPIVPDIDNQPRNFQNNVRNSIKNDKVLKALAIDDYDFSIRRSIIQTLTSDINEITIKPNNKNNNSFKQAKSTKITFGEDLKKSLEQASNTARGEYIPPNTSRLPGYTRRTPTKNSKNTNASLEERRAMLREKFRQAIERAQGGN